MPTYPVPYTYDSAEVAEMDGGSATPDPVLNVAHVESGTTGSALAVAWYNFAQQIFDLIRASHALGGYVIKEDDARIGVFPCDYSIAGTDYQYGGGSNITPPANATTYYYLDSSQTLGSVDSGTGWPGSEVHRLAEVTTDAGGNITSIRNVQARNYGRGAASSWSNYAAAANPDFDGYNPIDVGKINFDAAAELTISAGAVTVVNTLHTIDTESDAASDDLATISGGTDGDLVVLFPENVARVVTVKHGTGNIQIAGGADFPMNAANKFLLCILRGSTWYAIPSQAIVALLTGNLDCDGYALLDLGKMEFDAAAELTISAGAVTASKTYHDIDTESDAASDDLNTINGGTEGHILILKAEHAARTVVVKHSVGNIELANGQDFSLDDTEKTIVLRFDGTSWCEVARSYWDVGDFEGTSKAIPMIYTWSMSGSLSAGVVSLKYVTPSEYDLEFVNAIGRCNTAPSGGSCIIDVQDDGASLFANEGEMINIADGETSDVSATKNGTVAGGSVLSIEVKSTGGSPNGAQNATVVANFRAPIKLGS